MARHGENIRKRKDGRWEGRYKAFDPAKEQHVYRSVYGRSYGEAKDKLFRAKHGDVPGKNRDVPRSGGATEEAVLFSQAAQEWLAALSGRRKHSTCMKYAAVYRKHLARIAGSCPLEAGAADALREKISGLLSGEEMSDSLKRSIVVVANRILSFANTRYASGIPLFEQQPAKVAKREAAAFSGAEQARLLACLCAGEDKFRAAALLCLYSGLRLGEACALQWDDIDFAGVSMTVDRTVQRIAVPGRGAKTALLETDPKSASARRTIPLPPGILAVLARLREGRPYVFGGEKPLEPRTMQYRFQKILKEAGISGKSFHALRHTFATNCVESGMDAKSLSEILGHSDVKITLNRYVHPAMSLKRRQMEMLAKLYGQICGQAA